MQPVRAPIQSLPRIFEVLTVLALVLSTTVSPGLAANSIPTLGVVQQWSLSAPDAGVLDEFGYAVAIDGTTAVIGARNADAELSDEAVPNSGAAYVYVYNGNTWVLEAKLAAKDAAEGDTFGVSVSISGNTIVIGATGVDLKDQGKKDGELENAGAAYVFTRSGGTWEQQFKLVAADPAEEDSFGSGVAIYKNTVVVAAETKDFPPLVDVGAAYVFYNSGGKNWKAQAKLLPSDPFLGDYFGISVAIHGDVIAVGAAQFNLIGESSPGKVFVFKRNGKLWEQDARLEAENGRPGDAFGNSVAIYSRTLVIGAHFADPEIGGGRVTSAGVAYVFTDNGSEWKETAQLTAPDGLAFDQFGRSVDIYDSTIVVGAEGATQAGERGAGAVYIFKKSQAEWNFQTRAVTEPAGEDDLFGRSVAISRDWFVAGATGRNPNARTRAGEAFLNLLGGVQLPATGFAPGIRTFLPIQPVHLAYQDYGGMTLEIPALTEEMAIVGVPKSGSGWDVRWLADQAGYLEGTAFPTWQGNTGLAGHATLPDGGPGPFARLQALRWGDQVIIHAWGQRYIYEVRENTMVAPDQLKVLKHEDLDWVTLISCQGYDETSSQYLSRRVVRGVLVGVEED